MSRVLQYAARLFLHWLQENLAGAFDLAGPGEGAAAVWRAHSGDAGELDLVALELWESDGAWDARRRELEARLDGARPGSYLLWVPPGGVLPAEEPDESEWIRRVVLGASRLASGRRGEVRLPVKLMLGKIRDEGGYASVTGGLGRYWTEISNRLNGSFYLDSRGLNRLSRNEDERQQLFEHIGLVGQGLQSGDAVEFEHEDAWSVQRLPRPADGPAMEEGWAIAGCPPGFDPNDGGLMRRLLRKRLGEAREALTGARGRRAAMLIGPYDYIENENAGPALRGFDPALMAGFDAIVLVADSDVKPLLLSPGLRGGAD